MNLANCLDYSGLKKIQATVKKVFFYRVCGTGMGAAACLLKEKGYLVEGGDSNFYPPMSTYLESTGIPLHKVDQITREFLKSFDLIVVGNVIPKGGADATLIEELGVKFVSFPTAIGALVLSDVNVVGIAGTHGKTTTTFFATQIFENIGADPGYLIGGVMEGRPSAKLGNGKYFFIESDEYDSAYFEKQFWKTQLEVMVSPVPLSERVLIYRGLDGDFIHSGFSKGAALSQKEAILKDNAFIMSSMMVKNQGSWNRRLRSMEAMNSKVIATIDGEEELAQSARITTIFKNHSDEPVGSPFLSFSPDLSVANRFSTGKVSAYLVDPRMIHYNYASTITEEVEYLMALTSFPDDLVAIADDQLHGISEYDTQARKEFLNEKLIKKIETAYGKAESKAVLNKIKKNSYDFFHKNFKTMPTVKGATPGLSNKKFYSSLDTKAFKPDLGPKGELNCKDILQLFWVKN